MRFDAATTSSLDAFVGLGRAWLCACLAVATLALPSCSSDAKSATPTTLTPPAVTPAEPSLRRLTIAQYTSSIHDLFGDDVVVPTALEPDTSLSGFSSVGASVTSVSSRGIEQFETAAYKIADQALDEEHRVKNVSCTPSGTVDESCARTFVTTVGRRAWRRTLTDDETSTLVGIAGTSATALGDFHQGLEFALGAILQSPNFLYRVELGEEDPKHPGRRRYTSLEMASRISYLLWGTTPDDALLDAGEHGDLLDDKKLEDQVNRLLDAPRARQGVRGFFTELLELGDLDHLEKDAKVFTAMSADLGPSAREETLLDIEHLVFDDDADYRTLFTSRRTFLDRKMASLYMVPAPSREGFGETELPEDGVRVGLLGHASILALHAHPTSSSATLRGKFIRQTLLCDVIPSPPVNVNTSLPAPSADAHTLRERVKAHLEQPSCAACHKAMDPIGLGLENFDGIGEFRHKDDGEEIDASGDLDGVAFRDPVGLAQALAGSPKIAPCFAHKLYRFASGHLETSGELDTIQYLGQTFEASGFRVKSLLVELILGEAFRTSAEPSNTPVDASK